MRKQIDSHIVLVTQIEDRYTDFLCGQVDVASLILRRASAPLRMS